MEDGVGPIERGAQPFTRTTREVEHLMLSRSRSGPGLNIKGGRHEVDADHPGARGVTGQETDHPATEEAGRTGDDYCAHRPTMPL